MSTLTKLTNYVAYVDPNSESPRVGHLDLTTGDVVPMSFASGTPVRDLYQVIEAAGQGEIVAVAGAAAIPASAVGILPPLADRDVLAVGKNYMEHAKEFNSSGYDSSDKVDRPSHPVIFTKRATSIVADGALIEPHNQGFTSTLDYEGEIGVIVGKAGRQIRADDAWNHVWGYTIINDLTARERQRDHKQFFIGKSADTFCPMGPIAVPKETLGTQPLRIETRVNGELRQSATTDDLIFSIPELISTISLGQTLLPGDVLATGTPAGVGIGRNPPLFLKPGDEIAISVPGLGTLRNKVSASASMSTTVSTVSAFTVTNAERSLGGRVGLTQINGKLLHYRRLGQRPDGQPVVFLHGLGGTMEFWTPLISLLGLADSAEYTLHLIDLEGQGLSPTHPLSTLSIASLAADVADVFRMAGVSASRPATVIAHSMGCLVALQAALNDPALIQNLVLLGPPPLPLPADSAQGRRARAAQVRTQGMGAVVDAYVSDGLSVYTRKNNPLGETALRLSVLGQDPEGHAKSCQALAAIAKNGETYALEAVTATTLLVAGSEDKLSPPAASEQYVNRMSKAKVVVLPRIGHWHVYEDPQGMAQAVGDFCGFYRN